MLWLLEFEDLVFVHLNGDMFRGPRSTKQVQNHQSMWMDSGILTAEFWTIARSTPVRPSVDIVISALASLIGAGRRR